MKVNEWMQNKFCSGCLEGGNGALGKFSLCKWCWNYVNYSVEEILHLIAVFMSRWPRGLRRWSAAARLLRSWVRIPPGAWTFVECCQVGLCDKLTTCSGVLRNVAHRCVCSTNLMYEKTNSLNCDCVANWQAIRRTRSPRWRGQHHASLQVDTQPAH